MDNKVLRTIFVKNGRITATSSEPIKSKCNYQKFNQIEKFLEDLPKYTMNKDESQIVYWGDFQIIAMYSDGTFSATKHTGNLIREGYTINGFDVGNIVCIKRFTKDNVHEIHFNGQIESDDEYEYSLEIKKTAGVETKKEREVTKIAHDILNRYNFECYHYTRFNDIHDNIETANNIDGYNENQAYMIEVFSDLVDPSNFIEADFGLTDDYFDSIIEERDNMRQLRMEIEHEYRDENVKVTLSKWNQGCEYGMAMYIWIPFQ